MLVASLPALPKFKRAERIPITRLRLERRLRLLEPEESAQLMQAEALVGWGRPPESARDDPEFVRKYRAFIEGPLHPALREFVSFRMDQLTILAGLRRRRNGQAAPPSAPPWGAGEWVPWIEKHWEEPEFGLASRYRWLPPARQCLESREATALEGILLEEVWRRLGEFADANRFGFEAVFAYVFRWDILNYWLSRNAEAARKRFQELIGEVTEEGAG